MCIEKKPDVLRETAKANVSKNRQMTVKEGLYKYIIKSIAIHNNTVKGQNKPQYVKR